MKFSLILNALLMLSPFFSAYADLTSLEYDTLANRRPILVFPTYTSDQKQRIADQADYLIENYYVHRSMKEREFGLDSITALRKLKADAQSMTEADLHIGIQTVFKKFRDLHTNYYFPKPLQCYRSLLPFSVEQTQTAGGKMGIAVSAVNRNENILRLAPESSQISVGDVLNSMSGVDPAIVVQDFYQAGAGANPNAQLRRALEVLTYRSQMSNPVPVANEETLGFTRPDGTSYTIVLPWISRALLPCLAPPAVESFRNLPGQKNKKRPTKPFLNAVNEEQIEYKEFFSRGRAADQGYEVTEEPSISYRLIHNDNGDFGVIRLDSFEPTKLSDEACIQLISNLLNGLFQNTKGMILDIRGNGGGSIVYAEGLIQLFTPNEISPEGFQMLANNANRTYLSTTQSSLDFIPAIDHAITRGQELSEILNLSPVRAVNNRGQSYLRPVAVLTNSSCYSACDMFSAGMQDNRAAKIWATDGETGGGGANVVAYSEFQKAYPAGSLNPFLSLPGSQDMRIAWRRSIRVGLHANEVLENVGVTADVRLNQTILDLLVPDSQLFSTISKDLSDTAASTPVVTARLVNPLRQDTVVGQAFNIPMIVSGTSSVDLIADGKVIGTQILNSESADPKEVALTIDSTTLAALPEIGSIELVGYLNSLNSAPLAPKRVWRKVTSFRKIPSERTTLPVLVDLKSSTLSPFKIYQVGPESWNIVDGVMRIGKGPNYQDNVHAEASLFLNIPASSSPKLQLTSELHSEEGYDFFSVSVWVDGVETVVLAPQSGNVAKKDLSFDLSPFAGKLIEVRLTFDSDSGVNGIGPVISNLVVIL